MKMGFFIRNSYVNAIAAALKEFQPVMQHFKNRLILINMNNLTQSVDPQLNNLATFNSILIPTNQ